MLHVQCQRSDLPKVVPVLVATATPVEKEAVEQVLGPAPGRQGVMTVMLMGTVYHYGRIGQSDVIYLPGSMASGGRDGSHLSVQEAVKEWGSQVVLMPGIAFGKDDTDTRPEDRKQEIGDVLVSTHIIPYDHARIGKKAEIPRGGRPEAGRGLLNALRNLSWSWTPKGRGKRKARKLQFGPLLSGDKLIDNKPYKHRLLKKHPDAIGGEMEGYGVASAGERHKIEWIVFKGICDWGDGEKHVDKESRQALAAANSVSVLSQLLEIPRFPDGVLPRGPLTSEDPQALAQLVEKVRRLGRERKEKSLVIGRLKTGNSSPEAAAFLELELRAFEIIIDDVLNAYNDGCAFALKGALNLEAFNLALGPEVRQLVRMDGFQRDRLHPRETSPFTAIWAYFDRMWPDEDPSVILNDNPPNEPDVADPAPEAPPAAPAPVAQTAAPVPAEPVDSLSHDDIGMIHSRFNDFLNWPSASESDIVHTLLHHRDRTAVLTVLIKRVRNLVQEDLRQVAAGTMQESKRQERLEKMKVFLTAFANETLATANDAFGAQAMDMLRGRGRLRGKHVMAFEAASQTVVDAWIDTMGDACKPTLEMLAEEFPDYPLVYSTQA